MKQSGIKFMRRVLQLAKKGQRTVSPNPMVGAVFVKNGKIIAEGFHKVCGGPHAEINAINSIRRRSSLFGSDLYINLEPCVHFGKTPPCVPEIIKCRPARVIVAMKDPNPAVCGRGIRALQKAGIRVEAGHLKKEARRLNEKFAKWITTKTPFVALKIAMSIDGKIATKTGDSKWISSEKSRNHVKKMRDSFDAVLVGINTVIKDNPALAGFASEPKRVILDSWLKIPLHSKVLRDSNVIIVATAQADKRKIVQLAKRGIEIKIFKNKISIPSLLRFLAEKGISSLLVEGGAKVFGSFVDAKAVDRFYWFIAPKIIGGSGGKTAIEGAGAAKIRQAMNLAKMNISTIGPDVYIECEPKI